MICEFRIRLVDCEQDKLTPILDKAYQGKLAQAYTHSAYRSGTAFEQTDFCAGTITDGSLLLIYPLQADTLICYVEPATTQDLRVVKKTINAYFRQIVRLLEKNKIKRKDPEATITIEKIPFDGKVERIRSRVLEILKDQWEKVFITPIASILASYLAIKFNILSPEEYGKEVKNAVILTGEGYIGLIFMLFIVMAITVWAQRKEFKFKI